MQTQSGKFESILTTLNQDGLTKEEVLEFAQAFNKFVAGQYYLELLLALGEEKIKKINDEAKDQEEANQMIRKIFQEQTGQDTDELFLSIFERYCGKFLEEYKKRGQKPKEIIAQLSSSSTT